MHYCLPSNSLCYFIFFFRHDFVRAISLEPLVAETPNWVCCLVLRSNCALLFTIQFASLVFFFFFFCQDFVRAISLKPLLAETSNWVCCLVLRSNFALLLAIQFASLISSLINIIRLLLTTLEFFIFGGSLLGRIQGDREPVSFYFNWSYIRAGLITSNSHLLWNTLETLSGLFMWQGFRYQRRIGFRLKVCTWVDWYITSIFILGVWLGFSWLVS